MSPKTDMSQLLISYRSLKCVYILCVREVGMVLLGKVFKNGNSQAIRIPKELQLDCREVWIDKRPDGTLILRPRPELPEGYSNVVAYLLATAPRPILSKEELEQVFVRSGDDEMSEEIFK